MHEKFRRTLHRRKIRREKRIAHVVPLSMETFYVKIQKKNKKLIADICIDHIPR